MSAWNSRTLETFDLNVQLSLALLSETNPEVDWKNDEQFRPFCSMPRYPDKSKTRQSCLDLLGFFFSITYVHKVMFRTLFMGHTVFKVMWRSPMRNWLLSYHSTLPKVFYSSYKHRISAFSASWCNFVLNLDKVWVSTQGLVAEMFS